MFRVKVPKKPAAESVSIGNFSAELKPGSVLKIESDKFADYLVANFGCEVITEKDEPNNPAAEGGAN